MCKMNVTNLNLHDDNLLSSYGAGRGMPHYALDLTQTAKKAQLLTVTPLLPSNGCFSNSTVLALSNYAQHSYLYVSQQINHQVYHLGLGSPLLTFSS
jgi:hypothetical protein